MGFSLDLPRFARKLVFYMKNPIVFNPAIAFKTTVTVYINGGKPVGRIMEVKRNDGVTVYQYFPKGSKSGGE